MKAEDFSATLCTQPALEPIQPPVQWVLEIFTRGKCGRGVLLTSHALLMLCVKKERGYTSSPPVCQNWHAMGNLYLFFVHTIASILTHGIYIYIYMKEIQKVGQYWNTFIV
jgi:hypothetical protein